MKRLRRLWAWLTTETEYDVRLRERRAQRRDLLGTRRHDPPHRRHWTPPGG